MKITSQHLFKDFEIINVLSWSTRCGLGLLYWIWIGFFLYLIIIGIPMHIKYILGVIFWFPFPLFLSLSLSLSLSTLFLFLDFHLVRFLLIHKTRSIRARRCMNGVFGSKSFIQCQVHKTVHNYNTQLYPNTWFLQVENSSLNCNDWLITLAVNFELNSFLSIY